jgi:hypothetical protein
MTGPMTSILRFVGRSAATAATTLVLLAAGCGTEGSSSPGYYGDTYYDTYYNDDSWYWHGCCVDRPDYIGPPPPHPEHPIVLPPSPSAPRPEHPIANPSPPRPTQPVADPSPMPRPAVRGGGRFRVGGVGRGGGRR